MKKQTKKLMKLLITGGLCGFKDFGKEVMSTKMLGKAFKKTGHHTKIQGVPLITNGLCSPEPFHYTKFSLCELLTLWGK